MEIAALKPLERDSTLGAAEDSLFDTSALRLVDLVRQQDEFVIIGEIEDGRLGRDAGAEAVADIEVD